MDALFENKFTLTEQLAIESFSSLQKVKLKLFVFILIVLSFMTATYHVMTGEHLIYTVFFVTMGLFFIVLLYSGSQHYQGKDYYVKQRILHYYQPIEKTLLIYDHGIESYSSNGSLFKMDYIHITSVKKTKNLYLIVYDNNILVILARNGFTRGSEVKFDALLRNKYVRITQK